MAYLEEKSQRQIARELGLSRHTVARALAAQEPPTYTMKQARTAPKLGPYQARLEDLLEENTRLPKKQRYTAQRLFELLQAEGYSGSESSVAMYAVRWRKSQKRPATFLPLGFEPGQDAQVDWGEAQVIMAGIQRKVEVFLMHLCYSRRTFVICFPSQKQEAFLSGHVHAFTFFEGVPHRLSYDNLTTATKVQFVGTPREEQRGFLTFRNHYLFEAHFCTPNQGHEKGGVEGSVGFSRRNFLVPMPRVASFEELNHLLRERCYRDDGRVVDRQALSIGQAWQEERPYLRPLPAHPFDCCVKRQAYLNGYSQVTFETNRYSVPTERARRELTVKVYPFTLEVYTEAELLAVHPRCYEREQDIFDPLHYLFLLERRPGALDYARPLKEWRKDWPESYHQLLSRLRAQWPEGRGVKEFIQVLQLHQQAPAPLVRAAIEQALAYGAAHLDGVRHCLIQLQTPNVEVVPLNLEENPHLAQVCTQPVDLVLYEQLIEREGTR
jgi:transposase